MDLIYLANTRVDAEEIVAFSPDNYQPFIPKVVVHNFQHDLKSLWWIMFWTITDRVDYEPSREYAQTIFINSIQPSAERRSALVVVTNLHAVLKDSLSSFAKNMEFMRMALFRHYIQRVGADNLNPCKYANIHNVFQQFFDTLAANNTSSWASELLRVKSKAPTEAREVTTLDPPTVTNEVELSEREENQLDEPSVSAPQRRIRPIASRDSIRIASHSNFSQSQNLTQEDDESVRRSSKRLKSRR